MVALYERHGAEIVDQSLWRKLRTVGGILDEAYSSLCKLLGEAALRASLC